MEVGLKLLIMPEASILLAGTCLLILPAVCSCAVSQGLRLAPGDLLERAGRCGRVSGAAKVARCCAAQGGSRLVAPVLCGR